MYVNCLKGSGRGLRAAVVRTQGPYTKPGSLGTMRTGRLPVKAGKVVLSEIARRREAQPAVWYAAREHHIF